MTINQCMKEGERESVGGNELIVVLMILIRFKSDKEEEKEEAEEEQQHLITRRSNIRSKHHPCNSLMIKKMKVQDVAVVNDVVDSECINKCMP